MRHPLEVKLGRYRFLARVFSTLTASGYLFSGVAITLLLLGTFDWYARPDDPGVRLILWLLALAPLLYMPVSLYRAIGRRRSHVELAYGLEKAFPSLHNWLAGAVDFLQIKKESPAAGSKELRDAVIARATELSERLDFSETLDRRPLYRSIVTMALVLGLVSIVVVLHSQAAWIASRRLAQPLTPIAWPSKTLLVVKQSPVRLAQGSPFQAIVVDEHGRDLPEQATIYYRFDQRQPQPHSAQKDASAESRATPIVEVETAHTDGHQITLYRDHVDRSFAYRVTSGDDDRMPWQEVAVVEPPAIESLHVEIRPPAYVGDRSPVTVPVTDRTCIHEGSEVRMIAALSKPIRRATLLLGAMEYEGIVGEKGRQALFTVGTLDTSTLAERTCPIVLRLEDRHGLEVTVDRSQQLELIENSPPSVTLLRPGGGERVVASAVVPVDALVEDDLGVRTVVMYWTIEGIAGPRSSIETIYQGPDKLADLPQNVGACPAAKQKFTTDYRWDLRPLKPAVDDRLSLRVVATDYSGMNSISEPVELMVVDHASFINRLTTDQRAITDEMAQALAIGRRNLQRMNQALQLLEQSGKVDVVGVDLLHAILLDRRQIVRILIDENDGLVVRSASILAQLDNSRLQASSLHDRLERLVANLEKLRDETLPSIERNVTAATKNAEQSLDPQSGVTVEIREIVDPLEDAIVGQRQLVAKLEEMLGRLDDLVDYQRFCDDLKRLVETQRTLTGQTKTLGMSLLGRTRTDLLPTELARLEQLARDQALAARESGQTVARMVQAAKQGNEEERSRIARAVASPGSLALGTTLARASESIAQNQLGRAVQLQTESLAELESMLRQMTQVTDPTTRATGTERPIHIDAPKPGEEPSTADPSQPPSPSQDTGQPGDQATEPASFDSHGQPPKPTNLQPKTVDHLIERLWGELPARARAQLLQLPGERFLPGYEHQIESYYKQLLR